MDKPKRALLEGSDPGNWDYGRYYQYVNLLNRRAHAKVYDLLNRLCGSDCSKYAVNVTGSDGRLEAGPASKMELLVYFDGYAGAVNLGNHFDEIKGNLFNPPFSESMQGIEVKDAGRNRKKKLLSFYVEVQGVGLRPFPAPSRFFDAKYLFGDTAVMDSAMGEIALELSTPGLNHEISSYLEAAMQSHMHTTLTGEEIDCGALRTHFNLGDGSAIYFPDRNILGFKQGPLKLIQTALVKSQVDALARDRNFWVRERAPTNIAERITYLNERGAIHLSPESEFDLIDDYKYFLHLLHMSQWEYFQNDNPAVDFSVPEVSQRCRRVASLVKESLR